ncbi:hypothetical protein AYO38_04295 [bacterium SCGC AG-212-C10]|nr:hypothetical protein AYO38_04295 [bacterium SCGC AG-212-C10]
MNESTSESWAIRWRPDDQPPAGQRAAFHRLAAAIRRMNELLMDSEMPEDELLAAAEAAERFANRLADGPRGRPHWGYAETSNAGDTRAFFDSSPIIGMANPVAPPLTLWVSEEGVEGTARYGQQYEGPPGHVHGGFVAASFDEVLGMAQSQTGSPGMTGTLTVRYRRPTPLHREVRFRGKVDRVEGRKIFTSATLYEGETLCAEAEGLFISVDFRRFRDMAGEPENEQGS